MAEGSSPALRELPSVKLEPAEPKQAEPVSEHVSSPVRSRTPHSLCESGQRRTSMEVDAWRVRVRMRVRAIGQG